jgi:hypothetical protein
MHQSGPRIEWDGSLIAVFLTSSMQAVVTGIVNPIPILPTVILLPSQVTTMADSGPRQGDFASSPICLAAEGMAAARGRL